MPLKPVPPSPNHPSRTRAFIAVSFGLVPPGGAIQSITFLSDNLVMCRRDEFHPEPTFPFLGREVSAIDGKGKGTCVADTNLALS
jgi:hypothetical protein